MSFEALAKSLGSVLGTAQSGGMVHVRELQELQDLLRKAQTVGYQTPSSGGGQFAPLVPQSVEPVLTALSHEEGDIVFWNMTPKGDATQTLHEYGRIVSRGKHIEPFVGEGGSGTENKSELDKGFVKIRYLMERRELSDVATMVGLIGADPQALALETRLGTENLIASLEHTLLHSKAALSTLHYDGVIEQIRAGAPSNVTDIRGKQPTPKLLQAVLAKLYAAPRYGRADGILCSPTTHTTLINYAVDFGRRDQMNRGTEGIRFSNNVLSVTASYGEVPIIAVPFLERRDNIPPDENSGDSAPNAPTLTGFAHGGVDAPVAGSQWTADDEGDYIYQIVAVAVGDDGGYSLALTTAAYTVEAGGSIKIEVNNPVGIKFFKVYRSAKDGAADTCLHMLDVPVNTAGANGKTLIHDKNADIPGTTSILIGQWKNKRFYEFVRLMDLIRRPLNAGYKTTVPFALMLFGSPVIKAPDKFWEVRNSGAPDILSLALA